MNALLQNIANKLKIYESIPDDNAHVKYKNKAYMELCEVCKPLKDKGIYLNLKESHYGIRLWFDCGVLSTRFFWMNDKLLEINDAWNSSMGPFYFKTQYDNGRVNETWEETENMAQKSLHETLR